MSNSRHTPGPWDIEVSMGQDPHNSGVNIAVKSGYNYIADIFPTYPKRSASCANARLIAAAPELLAELKALLQFVEFKDYVGPDTSMRNLVNSLSREEA